MKKLLTIALVVMVAGGCDLVGRQPDKDKVVTKPALEKIDDAQLAKIILKPEKASINVSRDPFQPLISEEKEIQQLVRREMASNQDLKRFRFLGVFKENDEYVAFLKSGQDKGTYRKDDKVKDFTITKIGPEEVILTNGEQTVTLKRGESK